jgi:hypothetical protein
MRIYKTKWFHRWAAREGLTNTALQAAVMEMANGLADALGGHVYKKRIGLPGRGKRGGVRTLIAFRRGDRAIYLYGYPKNERANISDRELEALRLLAAQLLSYSDQDIEKAISADELIEVSNNGQA